MNGFYFEREHFSIYCCPEYALPRSGWEFGIHFFRHPQEKPIQLKFRLNLKIKAGPEQIRFSMWIDRVVSGGAA